jgi:DNA-binding MarR family transcriptional regulator
MEKSAPKSAAAERDDIAVDGLGEPQIVPALSAAGPLAGSEAEVDRGFLGALIGYHLRRADVFAIQSFTRHMAEDGISPGQLGVLLLVDANPGINQTRVGRSLGIDRSTLVSIIDGLEARDLLQRTPSPTDRRSHALIVTATGMTFLADLRPRLTTHEAELARNLSKDEVATLVALLDRIVEP